MRGNKFFKFIDIAAGITLLLLLKLVDMVIFPFRRAFKQLNNDFVVIKFSAMGDTVLLLPVLKKLKNEYPGSRITVVATEINRVVVENCRYVDEVMVFDLKWLVNPVKLAGFIYKLNSKKAATALDFDQWLRISPVIAFLSGAGKRIGFKTRGQFRHYLYTSSVAHSEGKHEIECFFDLIRVLGIGVTAEDTELFFDVPAEAQTKAEELLKHMGAGGRFAVIHPGCGAHGWQRQWPEEKYAKVVEYLENRGISAVVSVGKGEEPVYEKIRQQLGGGRLMAIKGESLQVLAALIRKSVLFISGNTGVMHLAAASGAVVIGLHGPTNPVKWGPLGKKSVIIKSGAGCSPCLYLGSEYKCRDRACMEGISADEVIKIIEKIL
jgi:ADP-heptose:LPS heptosyltransferase